MPARLTPEDYHALASVHGFKCLQPSHSSQAKALWRCLTCDTCWYAPYSDLKRKPVDLGCPGCYERRRGDGRRLPPEAYIQLGEATGWTHDDLVPKNTHTKSYWLCPGQLREGGAVVRHRQLKSYHAIQQDDGCLECSPVRPLTADDYRALAQRRGWRWLGRGTPKSNCTRTRWQCPNGHTLRASYDNIDAGMGCRYCHPRARKLPNDYHALADTAGLIWKGPAVRSVLVPTTWVCKEKGHRFRTTFMNVSRNATGGLGGCPECENFINGARVSRPQMLVAEIVRGEVNIRIGPFRVDVCVERDGVPVAIEYDSYYWHAHLAKRDRLRAEYLVRAGFRVLRIRSNQMVPSAEELGQWLDQLVHGAETVLVITLSDWGKGPTFSEVRRLS